MTAATRWFWLAALLVFPVLVRGYMIGPVVPLDDLANQADVIFQGTVVSNKTIENPDFGAVSGFMEQETEFQAWPIKGGSTFGGNVKFRHYARDPKPGFSVYAPQTYEFKTGKAYLVFAKQPPGLPPDTCQQIWMNENGMGDEGVLLCFRDAPFGSRHEPMKGMFWRDLTELLKSSDPADVIYAIKHLDVFSGGGGLGGMSFGTLSEFQHLDVLEVVHSFVGSSDPTIAQAALAVIGSHNPYMSRERAPFWLATIGSAKTPGLVTMDTKRVNAGGMIYWRELAAVVDSKADETTRVLAVTALGLVREPSLQEPLLRWLADTAPEIRGAAALLLADYLPLATPERVQALAKDSVPSVRANLALGIGYGQDKAQAPTLDSLLKDPDADVRKCAAMSLLSFAPDDPTLSAIFRSHTEDGEFGPMFIDALAQIDPATWLDRLAKLATSKDPPPSNWWGGELPDYRAQAILFDYLKTRPDDELKSGRDDRYFTILENTANNPIDLYALYVNHGLGAHAKALRELTKKTSPNFDYSASFDQVDRVPSAYR